MDRRRHRAGGAAAWRILRHCRTPDARPWPPPRPGARRRRLADAAAAAARQQRDARCGGRGSTSISAITSIEGTRLRAATVLASSHAVYGVTHLASLARLLPERDPHEDIYDMLDRTLDDFDDVGEAAAHLIRFELAMLAELGFGLDLENLRRDRGDHRPDLCVAEIRRRGVAGGRRSLARPAVAAAGVPARGRRRRRTAGRIRTCRTVLRSPACSCCATCWSRAGRAIPTPATALSTR